MRHARRSSLALTLSTLAVVCAGAARPARAQDPAAAEVLFNRGMAEWKAGRIEQGCKAIAESQRLDPRPGTLFTVATCEAEWGRVATAWARFGEYLALYDRLPADVQSRQGDRPRVARAQRDKLSLQMSQLTLSLAPGSPPGTIVKRNGVVMSEASLGIPLPVDAGEYAVTTEAPGSPVREERIKVAAGENRVVTLTVTGPAPVVPVVPPPVAPPPAAFPPVALPPVVVQPGPAPAPPSGPSGRRPAAFATGAVGLAGLALGGIAGGVVLGKKSTINAHCGAAIHSSDPAGCDATGLGAASGLSGLGIASTVGFVVGGAGVVTAVVLFALEPRAHAAQAAGAGRSLSLGLLSAGETGATFGAHGAW